MPDLQFLNNVNIQGNETVHGNELVTGNETVSGSSYVTENLTISGTTLALDTINLSGNLNTTGDENITGNLNVGGVANFAQNINVLSGISTTGNVVASAFFGDGSNLTGIAASSGAYLPLSGGNMSGPIAFGPYAYSQRIDGGLYDASRGGLSGISLICSVDYDFNWQAGWITALEQDRLTPRPLYVDGGAGTPIKVWNSGDNTGVVVAHTGVTFPDGSIQTTASALSSSHLWDTTYTTVCANSAQWSITTDDTKLALSGGVLTDGLTGTTAVFTTSVSALNVSSVYHGDGTYLTGVVHGDDSRLTDSRIPSGSAGGDLSGVYPAPTVSRMQGYTISTQTPANGQMLQWNGTAWTPTSIPTGGSGGGGVVYFLNQALSAESPTTNLPATAHQMGKVALSGQTILTVDNLSQVSYTLVGGFVTDVADPNVTYIPAGVWDFNVWGYSNANANNPTVLQALIYTYDGVNAPVLISTSPDATLTDSGLFSEILLSNLVMQTEVLTSTRIYVEFRAKATAGSKSMTIGFGGITPTHVHTTIPSVGGSGLVKVVNSVIQTPASLLVDADVAENAEIAQTKISGLTAALAGKVNTSDVIAISAGGTGSTSAATALAALSGFPITGGTLTDGITATTGTFTTSLTAPAVSGTHYGNGTNLTGLNASNITSGIVAISAGGTGATDAATARTNLGANNGASPDIQIFSLSGTWTKPVGAKLVVFDVVAGGGGGGAGGKAASGTAIFGGGGGGGGGYSSITYAAVDLTDATYSIAIGSGGTGAIFGGAAATSGGASTVTGFTQGIIARSTGGGLAGNGTTTTGTAGGLGAFAGNAGGSSNITTTGGGGSGSTRGPASGAAGGGCSTTNPFAGGIGGSNVPFSLAGGTGGALSTTGNGVNGGNGNIKTGFSSALLTGSGGGGGGASTAAAGNGGNGGNGNGNGTGGGGGGATQGSGNGGNGGNGMPGIISITTYF